MRDYSYASACAADANKSVILSALK
jgi:hypothetical protein